MRIMDHFPKMRSFFEVKESDDSNRSHMLKDFDYSLVSGGLESKTDLEITKRAISG